MDFHIEKSSAAKNQRITVIVMFLLAQNNTQHKKQGVELWQEAAKGPLGHRVEQPPMNAAIVQCECNLLIEK